jgi:branched-subunit amino acid aminotransferase/4-amino-4-deoxychorismate lyase
VWDGRFFRLDDHLERLAASCRKMRMALPRPKAEITQILLDMLKQSGMRDAFVQIMVTRGTKSVRDSEPGDTSSNRLYMFMVPYAWIVKPEMQQAGGASALVARTVRRVPPGSFDPTIKNLQWVDLTRGLFEARDRGAMLPFLTDGDGNLTEGSGYNIVVVKDGVLYTPDRGVLEDVTRKTVIEVAKAKGIEVRVEVVPVEAAYQADEIFVCSTAGGVMPITILDGLPIGGGEVGPVTKDIWDGYWALHWDEKLSFEVPY